VESLESLVGMKFNTPTLECIAAMWRNKL